MSTNERVTLSQLLILEVSTKLTALRRNVRQRAFPVAQASQRCGRGHGEWRKSERREGRRCKRPLPQRRPNAFANDIRVLRRNRQNRPPTVFKV